jgi:hypothetical protein
MNLYFTDIKHNFVCARKNQQEIMVDGESLRMHFHRDSSLSYYLSSSNLSSPAQRLLGLLTSFRDLLPAHGTAAAAASGVAMQIFFQVHAGALFGSRCFILAFTVLDVSRIRAARNNHLYAICCFPP